MDDARAIHQQEAQAGVAGQGRRQAVLARVRDFLSCRHQQLAHVEQRVVALGSVGGQVAGIILGHDERLAVPQLVHLRAADGAQAAKAHVQSLVQVLVTGKGAVRPASGSHVWRNQRSQ